MDKILAEEIRIEKLHKEHDLTSFQSQNKDLQRFLQEDAVNHQKLRLSVTFLWYYKMTLASYMTLLNDRITLKTDLKKYFQEKGVAYSTVPALKIGRLCVADDFLRQGLGKWMIVFALEMAKELSDAKTGCRFLTVDPKEKSVGFYQKLNFKILRQDKGRISNMYLDILTVSHEI